MSAQAAPATLPAQESRAPVFLGLTWVMVAISIVCTGLRFYSRVKITKKIWWDDWFALISLLVTLALAIMWTEYCAIGGGQHVDYLAPDEITASSRLNWISQPICVISLAAGKLAVAAMILRIQAPCRWRTITIWIMMGFMLVMDVVACAVLFTQCRPMSMLWEPLAHPDGTCGNPHVFLYVVMFTCSYMAFVDLALAALPVHMLWNLRMATGRKAAICVLLSTGALASVFAILKTIELPTDAVGRDLSWNNALFLIWNSVEMNVVIWASCTPAIAPLFDSFSKGSQASYGSNGRKTPAGYYKNATKLSDMSGKGHDSKTGYKVDVDGDSDKRILVHQTDIGYSRGHTQPQQGQGQYGIQVTRQFDVSEQSTDRMV